MDKETIQKVIQKHTNDDRLQKLLNRALEMNYFAGASTEQEILKRVQRAQQKLASKQPQKQVVVNNKPSSSFLETLRNSQILQNANFGWQLLFLSGLTTITLVQTIMFLMRTLIKLVRFK
jgi:hypothetical protein